MTAPSATSPHTGRFTDPARPLKFTFDGRTISAVEGQTIAAALYAAGVRIFSRSFKYHRPRGILSAGVEEPNALVQLESGERTEANLRATQIELYDGLRATSVNAWPSLKYDCRDCAYSAAASSAFGYSPLIRVTWSLLSGALEIIASVAIRKLLSG